MKIINASYEIITNLNGAFILQTIAECGRICYQSEQKTNSDHIGLFVGNLIKQRHESVLEHYSFTVRFICNRRIANQIERHRIASFSQESQRYCNYGKNQFDGEVTFIKPPLKGRELDIWKKACGVAESNYLFLVNECGIKPEIASDVLPNATKTELVMTANLREWRHMLKLRTDKAAHPQMRELMVPLLKELQRKISVVFDNIKGERNE